MKSTVEVYKSENLFVFIFYFYLLDANHCYAFLYILPEMFYMKKWSCSVICNSLRPQELCLPGFSMHGIFQARVLEWVAISFSRDLPDSGIEPRSPALQADTLLSEPPVKLVYMKIQCIMLGKLPFLLNFISWVLKYVSKFRATWFCF